MEQFTIYYGTPEGKDTKIGVDSEYPRRLRQQRITDGQILEVHTCVYEVSNREQELQRQYGVAVDSTPYHVIYFRCKSAEQRAKSSEVHLGKILSEETKNKISNAQKSNTYRAGTTHTDKTKSKMSAAQKGVLKPKVECPHCQKIGGINIMPFWHFDNCKHKG